MDVQIKFTPKEEVLTTHLFYICVYVVRTDGHIDTQVYTCSCTYVCTYVYTVHSHCSSANIFFSLLTDCCDTLQVAYSQVIPLPISQNPHVNHCLEVKGQGCEPHIVFSKTMLEFGPILPYSKGDEQEVVVYNPTPHPVEIYSLEYDKQYLEEEKVRFGSECSATRLVCTYLG